MWIKDACKRCGTKLKLKEYVPYTGVVVLYCIMCGRNHEDYKIEETKR